MLFRRIFAGADSGKVDRVTEKQRRLDGVCAMIWNRVRRNHPLVHCITNYVTANDCANLLLAADASPIMADDPEEAAQIAEMSQGVVLNLGVPNPRKIRAMEIAAQTAHGLGRPVVLDPVGVGCSEMRKQAASGILKRAKVSLIRGNAGEIRTLLTNGVARRGVDSDEMPADTTAQEEEKQQAAAALARELAKKYGTVVLLTGKTDIVTDGTRTIWVTNGHEMMRYVTGAGCMLSALAGACLAAAPDQPLEAALTAACAMGICGERAHARLTSRDGNAGYRGYIIDEIYHLTAERLEREAKYEDQ